MKLDFAIIGGQKCGSTYLLSTLGNHPQIRMPDGESAHFESPDYENGGIAELSTILSQFDQSKLIGIKRPNYLANIEAVERMNLAAPDLKMIAILRNPIERLKSAYFHLMNLSFIPVSPLNEGIDKLISGELKNHAASDSLIEFGMYGKYLAHYKKQYGDRLLILLYDDLQHDKFKVIQKCFSFLGVERSFTPRESVLNSTPQKVNYSLNRTHFQRLKNRHLYDYNESKSRIHIKEKQFIDRLMLKLIAKAEHLVLPRYPKATKKPDFEDELKNRLIKIYEPDIKRLESLINRDLSGWLHT